MVMSMARILMEGYRQAGHCPRKKKTVPGTVFCSITDKWIALGCRTAIVISINDVANGQLLAAKHEAGRSVYFGAFTSLIRL
jgi:hypothetical protein